MALIANLLINLGVSTAEMDAGLGRSKAKLNAFSRTAAGDANRSFGAFGRTLNGIRGPSLAVSRSLETLVYSGSGVSALAVAAGNLAGRFGGLAGVVGTLVGFGLGSWLSRAGDAAKSTAQSVTDLLSSTRSITGALGGIVGSDLGDRFRGLAKQRENLIEQRSTLQKQIDELESGWTTKSDRMQIDRLTGARKVLEEALKTNVNLETSALRDFEKLAASAASVSNIQRRIEVLRELVDAMVAVFEIEGKGTSPVNVSGFAVDLQTIQKFKTELDNLTNSSAREFLDKLATDWDRFNDIIQRSQDLFDRGIISQDQLNQIQTKATTDLRDSEGEDAAAIARKSMTTAQTALGSFKVSGLGPGGMKDDEAKKQTKTQEKLLESVAKIAENTKGLAAFAPFGP